MKDCGQISMISVIIPTYNRAGTIVKAVESVLAQEDVPLMEILIMDDGSSDATERIIRNLQDRRIRYFRLPHRGACAARNAGIKEAKGEYIAFQDSDDIWHKDKIRKQLYDLEARQMDIVFCAYQFHDSMAGYEGRYPEEEVPDGTVSTERLLEKNLMSTSMVFGKSECFKEDQFNESYPRFQDWEYALRLSRKYKLYYSSEILADVYLQKDSISQKPDLALKALGKLLQDNMAGFAESSKALDRLLEKYAFFSVRSQIPEFDQKERNIIKLTADVEHLAEDNQRLFREVEQLGKEAEEARIREKELNYQLVEVHQQLDLTYDSFSWRITAPLRKCREKINRLGQFSTWRGKK